MTCDKRDQELLLLAHGALPLPRRLVVQAHLRRCAACRKRFARLTQVSSTLSAALCASNRLPWSPAWGMARTGGATFGVHLAAILSLLLFAVTATVLYLVFSGASPSCRESATPPPVKASTVHPSPLKIHCLE